MLTQYVYRNTGKYKIYNIGAMWARYVQRNIGNPIYWCNVASMRSAIMASPKDTILVQYWVNMYSEILISPKYWYNVGSICAVQYLLSPKYTMLSPC